MVERIVVGIARNTSGAVPTSYKIERQIDSGGWVEIESSYSTGILDGSLDYSDDGQNAGGNGAGLGLQAGVYEYRAYGITIDGTGAVSVSSTPASITVELTDTTAPVLQSAIVEDVSPSALILNYNETLDNTNDPAIGDFTINVTTGAAIAISTANISSDNVIITFDRAIIYGDVFDISYTAGINPIRDVAENNAANFSSQIVTNNVDSGLPKIPTVNSPSILGYSEDEVLVGWNTLASAVGYRVNYGTTSGNLNNSVQTDVQNEDWIAVAGLSASTTYYFEIITLGDGISYSNSDPTNEFSATTTAVASELSLALDGTDDLDTSADGSNATLTLDGQMTVKTLDDNTGIAVVSKQIGFNASERDYYVSFDLQVPNNTGIDYYSIGIMNIFQGNIPNEDRAGMILLNYQGSEIFRIFEGGSYLQSNITLPDLTAAPVTIKMKQTATGGEIWYWNGTAFTSAGTVVRVAENNNHIGFGVQNYSNTGAPQPDGLILDNVNVKTSDWAGQYPT